MTAPLTLDDIRAVFARYALGDVVAAEVLPLRAHNAPYYRVETTRGHYFLKRYVAFTPNADSGLDLIVHLRRRGYPAVEVLLSAGGAPHVTHGGTEVAVFELLDPWAYHPLTTARATALGAALGRLHVLAAGFHLPDTYLGHGAFLHRLKTLPGGARLPHAARETLDWMRERFPALGAAPDQPRGACHAEFVLEHVAFAGDEVSRVIDWDLIGVDFLLHDLGTALYEAVHVDAVDVPTLAAVVRGYETHRHLTPWERGHLYEAACFGACKFLIWELQDDWLDAHGPPSSALRKVDALRALSKPAFDALLADLAPPPSA